MQQTTTFFILTPFVSCVTHSDYLVGLLKLSHAMSEHKLLHSACSAMAHLAISQLFVSFCT